MSRDINIRNKSSDVSEKKVACGIINSDQQIVKTKLRELRLPSKRRIKLVKNDFPLFLPPKIVLNSNENISDNITDA